MLIFVILSSLLLVYSAGAPTVDSSVPDVDAHLTADEADQVAQSIIDAGLQGIVLLRVRYVIEDIDSCNMVQSSIYEVQLQSTSETFEISSESNITDATNCRNKRKLLEAIQLGGLIRVQNVMKIEGDQIQPENISVEQFRLDMEKLVPEDFRIVDSKFSYQFATDGEVTSDAELIEMRVRMVNTGNEYVVNTIGAMEVYGAMAPRARPYPPKVLLSLLGGGSYKKMKRITKT